MRYGALITGSTIEAITDNVERHRADGFDSAWLTDGSGYEPLTVLGIVGRSVPDIELGTAVVRTHPRHPVALAQQALTVNDAIGGRLALGVGPSHRRTIEGTFAMSFDRPIRHVREYLEVLGPLLRDGSTSFSGETVGADATLYIDGGRPCPLLVAALGPHMLRLAGEFSDGVITFMTGPQTLARLTAPILRESSMAAGRAMPRIIAVLPVIVSSDIDRAREHVLENYGDMASLPSYAAAIEREGHVPVLAGTPERIRGDIADLERIGVTDLVLTRVARRNTTAYDATVELVTELLRQRR